MEQPKNDVLKVKRLHVEFQTSHGMVHAVRDVSLEVKRGRIHALVGESGSGKSVTSLTIMNLLAGNGKVISGDVTLNEKSLLKLSGKEKRQLYGDRIGMIFQDPTAALDPLFTVEQLLLEGLRKHRRMSKKQARESALESLRMMNLRDPEELMKKKPYELSGGMCQRVTAGWEVQELGHNRGELLQAGMEITHSQRCHAAAHRKGRSSRWQRPDRPQPSGRPVRPEHQRDGRGTATGAMNTGGPKTQ